MGRVYSCNSSNLGFLCSCTPGVHAIDNFGSVQVKMCNVLLNQMNGRGERFVALAVAPISAFELWLHESSNHCLWMFQRVKQEQLKVNKIKEARELMYSEREEAKKVGGKEGIVLLLQGSATDSLASQLDAKFGATVTDHAIYKSHTLK